MENKNEQEEQETIIKVKRERPSNIGIFTGIGLLGFWFGIGAALGAKMVNSLEEPMSRK